MKRQKITPGSILEIPIDNKYYVYAQILKRASYVFFDYKVKEPLRDFSPLQTAPILFITAVYSDIITQGHWLKVGKMEIREDCKILPLQYIYHEFDKIQYELYNAETGVIVPATKEECRGLEPVVVWDSGNVEERIKDYYEGKKNTYVEYFYKKAFGEDNIHI